ncbi:uncharacterized protein [Lolium perenne]|uniref:uncharacterized protein n=1 Tax=Lolium perenne TaxID=4522 RepID=UPI003A996691
MQGRGGARMPGGGGGGPGRGGVPPRSGGGAPLRPPGGGAPSRPQGGGAYNRGGMMGRPNGAQNQVRRQGAGGSQAPPPPPPPLPRATQVLNTAAPIQPMEERYRNVVCYNCGEPGHYVGNCIKEKVCFMCGIPGHHMNNCGLWGKPIPMADYVGSANSGLGFFHVNVVESSALQWLNLKNCGIIQVTHGKISLQELEVKMCEAWDAKWPWQVRQLEEKKFLVRFPPHRKISDLVDIPSINLKEGNDMERVTVKIIGWEGDIPDVGELKTCWVQIRGIPPKWVSWEVIAQIAKTLGLLLDVDWGTIFKSFYEVVRVQLAVKDIHKIPEERIYVMKKKFYWVIFEVEKVAGDGGNDSNNDDNDPDGEDPGCEDGQEGFDELEDMNEGGGDDSHTQTPGVQFGSIGKNDKRHGAKSCPVIINVPDSNSFQPLVDFGLVDDDEMVEAGNMDGVTAGMNEVKITEAANKEEALEMMPMITRQVDEARDMDSMNQDEAEVAEKKNNEPMTCWDENHPTPMEAKLLMAKKTKRDKWGPVLPVRQSERISRDGKSMLERATSRLEIKNLEKPAGNLEENCQASQEMDAVVQGKLAANHWELVREAGEEGFGNASDRLALKKRKLMMKMTGPGTPEARGDIRVKLCE